MTSPATDDVSDFEQAPPEPEAKPATVGWHRHKWTVWGEPFRNGYGGLSAAFVGNDGAGPYWQERRCTRCNQAERIHIELGGPS